MARNEHCDGRRGWRRLLVETRRTTCDPQGPREPGPADQPISRSVVSRSMLGPTSPIWRLPSTRRVGPDRLRFRRLLQQETAIDHVARGQHRGDAGAVDPGEAVGDGSERAPGKAPPAGPAAGAVAAQSLDDVRGDVALDDRLEAAPVNGLFPLGDLVG